MSIVEGVVEQISPRGKATNIKVNGNWYGCGFNGVPCQQGDQVSFPVVQNGQYLNADTPNMQIIGRGNQNAPAQQQQAQPQTGGGNSGGGNPASSNNRRGSTGSGYGSRKLEDPVQVSITQQSARNAAIQALNVAAQADAIPLPAKKADKLDAFLALVDQVAERYYKETLKIAKAGGYVERAEYEPVGAQQADQPNAEYDDDIPF